MFAAAPLLGAPGADLSGLRSATSRRRFQPAHSPIVCVTEPPAPSKKNSKQAAAKAKPTQPAAAKEAKAPAQKQPNAGREASEQDHLASWMAKAGVKAPNVALKYFGDLRGLVATGEIKPKDLVITVPRSAALEATSIAGKCPHPDVVDPAVWAELPWFMRLAVEVCIERRKGDASPRAGWVQLLPERVDVPFFWSDGELAGLGYPAMTKAVKDQREAWGRHFEKLKGGDPSLPFSEAELYSAAAAVCSRAFAGPQIRTPFRRHLAMVGAVAALSAAYGASGLGSLDDAVNAFVSVSTGVLAYDFIYPRARGIVQPGSGEERTFVLCPVVDLANHRSGVASDVAYEYFYDQYALTTSRPGDKKQGYAPGEQVFIRRAPRSRYSPLLRVRGGGLPHEIVVLASNLSALVQEYPAVLRGVPAGSLAPRIRALSESGLLYRERVYVARDLKFTVNGTSAAGLRGLLATAAEDGASAEPLPESASIALAAHFQRPASEETEAAIQRAVRVACREALDAMPPAREPAEGASARERLAAAFLREKRLYLEELLKE
eukprot:tig00021463_g21615.t1